MKDSIKELRITSPIQLNKSRNDSGVCINTNTIQKQVKNSEIKLKSKHSKFERKNETIIKTQSTKSNSPRVKELLKQLEENKNTIKNLLEENKILNLNLINLKESVNKLKIKNNELERIKRINFNKHTRYDSWNSFKKENSEESKETQDFLTPICSIPSLSSSAFKPKNKFILNKKLYQPQDSIGKSKILHTESFNFKRKNITLFSKKEFNMSYDLKFPNEDKNNKSLDFQMNQIKLRTMKILQSYSNLAKKNLNYIYI